MRPVSRERKHRPAKARSEADVSSTIEGFAVQRNIDGAVDIKIGAEDDEINIEIRRTNPEIDDKDRDMNAKRRKKGAEVDEPRNYCASIHSPQYPDDLGIQMGPASAMGRHQYPDDLRMQMGPPRRDTSTSSNDPHKPRPILRKKTVTYADYPEPASINIERGSSPLFSYYSPSSHLSHVNEQIHRANKHQTITHNDVHQKEPQPRHPRPPVTFESILQSSTGGSVATGAVSTTLEPFKNGITIYNNGIKIVCAPGESVKIVSGGSERESWYRDGASVRRIEKRSMPRDIQPLLKIDNPADAKSDTKKTGKSEKKEARLTELQSLNQLATDTVNPQATNSTLILQPFQQGRPRSNAIMKRLRRNAIFISQPDSEFIGLSALKTSRSQTPDSQQFKPILSTQAHSESPISYSNTFYGSPRQTVESNLSNSSGMIPLPPSPNLPISEGFMLQSPSVFSSSLMTFTTSTKKTQPTVQSSMTSCSNYIGSKKQLGVISGAQIFEDIKEDSEHQLGEPQVSEQPSETGCHAYDELSLVSQGSTLYAPEQKDDVVQMFSQVMLKRLALNFNYNAANDSSRQHFLSHITSALKIFTESVQLDPDAPLQVKGTKMVRRLRLEIARRLQDSIIEIDEAAENKRTPIKLVNHASQMNYSEKISRWNIADAASNPLDNLPPSMIGHGHTQSEAESESNASLQTPTTTAADYLISDSNELEMPNNYSTGLYGTSINPIEILKHFTEQPAFESLIKRTQHLIELYHSHKMQLIRHRVSLSLRRYSANCKESNTSLRAVFHVDWSLQEFLENNYEAGINQRIKQILAVTGVIDNAKLCSVGEYFRWCWPHYSHQLLKALQSTLKELSSYPSKSKIPQAFGSSASGRVTVVLEASTVIAEGTEDFIVSIAQQVSWLAAAFQEKKQTLTSAYVGFSEANDSDLFSIPAFDVDVVLEKPTTHAEGSCWNDIVGPAVLITGFSLPDRKDHERGLEVSIPVMASIAGTPQAVTFGGGFIFKARHHALVPIEDTESSIQWHLVDTYPKKLEWSYIDKACPKRLRGYTDINAFKSRRSFLGWCPDVIDLLATTEFDYQSVRYSKAGKPSQRAQIDKLVIGFNHWGTLAADFTLGKMDGFQNQRADDYDTLLDDARSMHIVLHDTTHRRAFQTNAEDLILHILLHRSKLNPPNSNSSVHTKDVEDLQFAGVDRRKISTREVMLSNCEKIISFRHQFSSSKLRKIRFKDEVKSLYSTIDGLWANSYADSNNSLKLSLEFGQTVSGWEYMQMVESSRTIYPKSITLVKTCGQWNRYAKDIQAVVLFAGNFGDIFQPALPNTMCSSFKLLPKDKCYLALRVNTLEHLFDHQGSLEDQRKLTDSGLTLQGSKDLFNPCDQRHRNCKTCCSHRVTCLVSQSVLGKNHTTIPLKKNGAIIIGGIKNRIFSRLFQWDQEEKKLPRAQQTHQVSYSTSQEINTTSSKYDLESSSLRTRIIPNFVLDQKLGGPGASQVSKSLRASSYDSSITDSSVVASEGFNSISSINPDSISTPISSSALSQQAKTWSNVVSATSSKSSQHIALDPQEKKSEHLASKVKDLGLNQGTPQNKIMKTPVELETKSPIISYRVQEINSLPELDSIRDDPVTLSLQSVSQQSCREGRLRRKPKFSEQRPRLG